jgi:asparagine synthase (glutamine-hydrolysing)
MILENSDKAAAALNVEPRYPFFDRRLVEFCIALPPGQRIYNGWTRSIFRHSMQGLLPADVQWRTDKSNIGASLKINLHKYGFQQLEDALYKDSSLIENYMDVKSLRAAYHEYKSDPQGKDSVVLLMLTTVYLSSWLKQAGFNGDSDEGQQWLDTAA